MYDHGPVSLWRFTIEVFGDAWRKARASKRGMSLFVGACLVAGYGMAVGVTEAVGTRCLVSWSAESCEGWIYDTHPGEKALGTKDVADAFSRGGFRSDLFTNGVMPKTQPHGSAIRVLSYRSSGYATVNVYLFPSAGDAEDGTLNFQPRTHVIRVRNVLVAWRGRTDPQLRTAIEALQTIKVTGLNLHHL